MCVLPACSLVGAQSTATVLLLLRPFSPARGPGQAHGNHFTGRVDFPQKIVLGLGQWKVSNDLRMGRLDARWIDGRRVRMWLFEEGD